ncbi:MAG: glycosyltransferase family 9 protein [Bacteroidetes bacterium]|nr:glycosyltransferase family 9 protein [Bacteroidota bacterium]
MNIRKKIHFLSVWFRKQKGQGTLHLWIQLTSLGDAATLAPVIAWFIGKNLPVGILCRPELRDFWLTFLPEDRVYTAGSVSQIKNINVIYCASISPTAALLSMKIPAEKRFGMVEDGRYFSGSRLAFDDLVQVNRDDHVYSRFARLAEKGLQADLFPESVPGSALTGSEGHEILLHPGGKWKPRRWPADRFAELAGLLEQSGRKVRFLLNESEIDLISFFSEQYNKNLVITRSVSDLMSAIGSCMFFIGNDSGPAHIARLYGKPALVLWGPGNEKRIRPVAGNITLAIKDIDCRPCRQYESSDHCSRGENDCLLRLSVQEVFTLADQLISQETK